METKRHGRIATAVVLWLVFSLLADGWVWKIDPQETPVAFVLGALAAAATLCALDASSMAYRFRWSWLGVALRLPWAVVRDSAILFAELVRRACGRPARDRIRVLDFDPGEDDAEAAARQALVIAAVSFGPNTIALRTDSRARTLVVHELTPGPPQRDARWPL